MSLPRMHVSLYVTNIYQTADFYTRFFGQDPDKIKPDYCKFTLAEPSLIISFVQNPDKVGSNFGHLGFQIESMEELETRLGSARSSNLPVMEEMDTNCCYANQDKFWVKDPDGYLWETYLLNKDVAWNDPRYQKDTNAVACCTPTSPAAKPKVNLSKIQNNCTPESGCC